MQCLDIHIKVELELDNSERPQRVAQELERILNRHYCVRRAEVTSIVNRDE